MVTSSTKTAMKTTVDTPTVVTNSSTIDKPKPPEPILPETRSELRRLLTAGINLGWKRSLSVVIADLSKPLPDEFINWKDSWSKGKKGNPIPYIKWSDANLILDYITPGWQIELRENQISDRAIVTAKITLLCEEGLFARESTGSDETTDNMFGGFMPDAESQAVRRAAAKFGLGLYLYDSAIVKFLIAKRNKQQ